MGKSRAQDPVQVRSMVTGTKSNDSTFVSPIKKRRVMSGRAESVGLTAVTQRKCQCVGFVEMNRCMSYVEIGSKLVSNYSRLRNVRRAGIFFAASPCFRSQQENDDFSLNSQPISVILGALDLY
jgi:hypothetical protein